MSNNDARHLLGVLVHPTKSFGAIAERPNFWPPMLLFFFLGGVVGSTIYARIDWVAYLTQRAASSGKEVSPEEISKIADFLSSTLLLPWIVAGIVVFVAFPLMAGLSTFRSRLSPGSAHGGAQSRFGGARSRLLR